MGQRRVLITGAGSGLGQALAHRYARAGDKVACVDLDAARAELTRAALAGDGHLAMAANVARELLSSNRELQETRIGLKEINIFASEMKKVPMNSMYLQLLQTCCSCSVNKLLSLLLLSAHQLTCIHSQLFLCSTIRVKAYQKIKTLCTRLYLRKTLKRF